MSRKPSIAIGPLSNKEGSRGKHWAPPREDFEAPTRITNSSSREVYVPSKAASTRPGADDHRAHKSRGIG